MLVFYTKAWLVTKYFRLITVLSDMLKGVSIKVMWGDLLIRFCIHTWKTLTVIEMKRNC